MEQTQREKYCVGDHPICLTVAEHGASPQRFFVPGLVFCGKTQRDWTGFLAAFQKKLSRCFAAPKTHHIGLHGVRLYWAVGVVKKKIKRATVLHFSAWVQYQLPSAFRRIRPRHSKSHQSKRLWDPERKIFSEIPSLQFSKLSWHALTHSAFCLQIKFCVLLLCCFVLVFWKEVHLICCQINGAQNKNSHRSCR